MPQAQIVASAAKPHKMIVPQPGWAEHRPREDWWDDFTFISRKLLADSRIAPSSIRAVGASAIGPCMLPVDADGEPLMNAVLYGVDTRAARGDRRADRGDRRGRAPRPLRQRADLAVGRAEDPVAQAQPAGDLREDAEDPDLDLVPGLSADRRLFVIDHYTARRARARSISSTSSTGATRSPRTSSISSACRELAWTTDIAGGVTRARPRRRPGSPPARR